MKKNILIAVFALATLAPSQIFAQAQEGQTPSQQATEVIRSIKKELSLVFPQMKETEKYSLQLDEKSYLSQGAHGKVVQPIDAEYLYYSNNSKIIQDSFIKGIKEANADDFNFDLYQIGFVEKDQKYYLVAYLDYQNPASIEELQKKSLEGTGLTISDLEEIN
jgi:hypothetical protein